MKIALLSDIHGNQAALDVIMTHIDRWQPDATIVNGDVINRGPRSKSCWDIIHERVNNAGWLMTRGNHEEYVIEAANSASRPPLERDLFQPATWTLGQFSADIVPTLKNLPTAQTLTVDSQQLRATHGTVRNTRKGIVPTSSDDEIRERMRPAPDVFVTGHTHRIFTRTVDQTVVINTGSVGVPLDGDSRAGYVQLTWNNGWHIDLVRLDYDRDAAERDFQQTNFIEGCGPTGYIMYREWRDACSYFPDFFNAWHDRMTAGEVSAAEAVKRHFASIDS